MAIWLRFCNGFACPKVTSETMFQIGFLEETLFRTIRNYRERVTDNAAIRATSAIAACDTSPLAVGRSSITAKT